MDGVVSSYNDFQGLAKLRAKAQEDQMSAAREVGQQFEAFFIQMMLKSMRDAGEGLKSGLWESSAGDSYEEMFDAELATSLAKTEEFGITSANVDSIREGKKFSKRVKKYVYEQQLEMFAERTR